jgi:hypothetical protein
MSYREIADHTESSLPAVETALFRARSSLRRQYRRAGGTISGLAWLGFGLRGLSRGARTSLMSAPARWAASIQDRVNAVLARLPGSSPGDLVAGVASLTAVTVLAGVVAWSPGTAGGVGGPPAGGATASATAAASHIKASHDAGTTRSDDRAGTSSPAAAQTAADAAGQDPTGGLDQQSVQQVGSAALSTTGQVVQDATDAVKKATDDVTNTVSNTVNTVTSGGKTDDDSTLPGVPGL